ncbi:MAG: MYXO-CTERM sorting domain-containing protein, partial [Myxococcota bacterium]
DVDFDGIDSFEYTISDAGSGRSHTGVVRLDVLPLPTALPDVVEPPTGSAPGGSVPGGGVPSDPPGADPDETPGSGFGETVTTPSPTTDDTSGEQNQGLDSQSAGCSATPTSLALLALLGFRYRRRRR